MDTSAASTWSRTGYCSASTRAVSTTPPAGFRRPATRRAIEGLMVDTADVLYDATLWPRLLLRLVHRLGVEVTYQRFAADWQRNYLADVHCGRREYDEAFCSFLLAAGLSWAQIDEVEAASRIERQKIEQTVRPLPGVVATISELRRRCPLRLVAWADAPHPAPVVAEQLARLGLADHFGAVLSSFDLEAAQPAPECYQAALDALQLPADRVAYLGHDALHLAGAQAAGLRTIAFNFPPETEADFLLSSFEELLPLVRSMLDAGIAERPGVALGGLTVG